MSLKLLPSDWCSLFTCRELNRLRRRLTSDRSIRLLLCSNSLQDMQPLGISAQGKCTNDHMTWHLMVSAVCVKMHPSTGVNNSACLVCKSSAGGCLILWRPQALQHIHRLKLRIPRNIHYCERMSGKPRRSVSFAADQQKAKYTITEMTGHHLSCSIDD